MKLPIKIQFNNGEEETYIVNPPDWAKWEQKTGKNIRESDKIGINDLLLLAYNSMARQAGNKPVKSFDVWSLTVDDIEVGEVDPKVTQSEA